MEVGEKSQEVEVGIIEEKGPIEEERESRFTKNRCLTLQGNP